MKNNIITVLSTDVKSIEKGIAEVKKLFNKSVQSAVFTQNTYEGKVKDVVDKFMSLGCPFIKINHPDDAAKKLEETKAAYQNIVLVN